MSDLLTTSVGSFPKPPELQAARNKMLRGELGANELEQMEREATASWIKTQEELGIDILVDGEMDRGDMVTYFSELLDGFTISGLVRSYGNRYYRKPIAVGPIGRKSPMTLKTWEYAQSLTDKPVKGMLTGPYTIAEWSFNEYYSTFEEFVMEVAKVVHAEAIDLEAAGAKYIQIDEPAASTRPEEMELVARSMEVVTEGLSAYTLTHICYGDFEAVFDDINRIPVDNLDIETANSNYSLLELFRGRQYDKHLSLGVTDVHTHQIESLDEVKAGIRKALEIFSPSQLFIGPDCGLKTRTAAESISKLKVMVQAVGEIKTEMGLS
ncbi:MAG: methionine synthase [Chloroflexota bacterium]|nr:methionine synthase [Chloroflexota bacterium]